MANSIFEDIRVGILGNAHDLLGKIIDLNSPAIVRQHIRDLENSTDALREATANAIGGKKTADRNKHELEVQIDTLDQNIDFILSDRDRNNDHLALPMQTELNEKKTLLTLAGQEVSDAEKTVRAMTETLSALQAKHEAMMAQLTHLEALDRATKAKEQAAKTISSISSLSGTSADTESVDDEIARMQHRADVADARLDSALGGLSTQVGDDVKVAQAKADLEARKARLSGNAQPVAAPAVESGMSVAAAERLMKG